MNKTLKTVSKVITFTLLILNILCLQAEVPKPMNPHRFVNDYAQIFNKEQREILEQLLTKPQDDDLSEITRANNIYIVSVEDLNGVFPADYASEIFYSWSRTLIS